jgi:hypothetical protein
MYPLHIIYLIYDIQQDAQYYDTIGGWSKLYNEKLHNLYSSPNAIRMIMSMRM